MFPAAPSRTRPTSPGRPSFFAGLYQTFILRFVIFLACVAIFGNLIRRETLDRSLHYYFLSPVRRELLVVAKYVTGLIVSFGLFGLTTVVSFVLTYLPHDSTAVQHFLFHGPGLGHLGAYLLVTFLACVGYGAVFLFFGFFFKSPAMPALAVFGWEGIHFLLPPLLKQVSVIHYLQSLCPVPVSEGPLAILSDAPAPWVSVVGLSRPGRWCWWRSRRGRSGGWRSATTSRKRLLASTPFRYPPRSSRIFPRSRRLSRWP